MIMLFMLLVVLFYYCEGEVIKIILQNQLIFSFDYVTICDGPFSAKKLQ